MHSQPRANLSKAVTRRFLLFLLSLALFGADDKFEGVSRIVAVGDVHGDYDQFVGILRSAGIINARNKWTGGKAFLVQTGDVVDRGPASMKVMDLLMDLEKQAPKAGGRVIPMLGNHECMNMYGDLRYVSAAEYKAFATADSEQIRNAYMESEKVPDTPAVRKQWLEEHPIGWVEHRVAFSEKGKYGKWLRTNKAVVQVNDLLFLHGGISPKYVAYTREEINARVEKELGDFNLLKDGMVIDEFGPFWYRGLAQLPEPELTPHVDQVLKNQGVAHIVIGHTPTTGAVMPRFGGKVVMIDVGMSKVYGGPQACLIIEGGKLQAMHRGKLLPLPVGQDDIMAYLKAAAALDPQPSPLDRIIKSGTVSASREDK